MKLHVTAPTTLLGVLFIALKLTHYIDWSWWWVLAPFWGAAALAIGIFVVTIMTIVILDFFSNP